MPHATVAAQTLHNNVTAPDPAHGAHASDLSQDEDDNNEHIRVQARKKTPVQASEWRGGLCLCSTHKSVEDRAAARRADKG